MQQNSCCQLATSPFSLPCGGHRTPVLPQCIGMREGVAVPWACVSGLQRRHGAGMELFVHAALLERICCPALDIAGQRSTAVDKCRQMLTTAETSCQELRGWTNTGQLETAGLTGCVNASLVRWIYAKLGRHSLALPWQQPFRWSAAVCQG